MTKKIIVFLMVFLLCVIPTVTLLAYSEKEHGKIDKISVSYKSHTDEKIKWSLKTEGSSDKVFETTLHLSNGLLLDEEGLKDQEGVLETLKRDDESSWTLTLEPFVQSREITVETIRPQNEETDFTCVLKTLQGEEELTSEESVHVSPLAKKQFTGKVLIQGYSKEDPFSYLLRMVHGETKTVVQELEMTSEDTEYNFHPVFPQGEKQTYYLEVDREALEEQVPAFVLKNREDLGHIELSEESNDISLIFTEKTSGNTEEKTTEKDMEEGIDEVPVEEPEKPSEENNEEEVISSEEDIKEEVDETPAEEPEKPTEEDDKEEATPQEDKKEEVDKTPTKEPEKSVEEKDKEDTESGDKETSKEKTEEDPDISEKKDGENEEVKEEDRSAEEADLSEEREPYVMKNIGLRGMPTNPYPRVTMNGWDITEAVITDKTVEYTFYYFPSNRNAWITYSISVVDIEEAGNQVRVTWSVRVRNSSFPLTDFGNFNSFQIIGNTNTTTNDYERVVRDDITAPTTAWMPNSQIVSTLGSIAVSSPTNYTMHTYVRNTSKHKNTLVLEPLRTGLGTAIVGRGDVEYLTIYKLYDAVITKTDKAGRPIRSGSATFKIYGENGIEVATGETVNGSWHIDRVLYATAEYTIVEETPPEGYEIIPEQEEHTLYIDENGVYYLDGVAQNSNQLNIANRLAPLDVDLRKIDKRTGESLVDVHFDYYRVLEEGEAVLPEDKRINAAGFDDPNGSIYIRKIDTLITNAQGILTLSQIREGTYVLRELDTGTGNDGYQLLDKYIFLKLRPDRHIEFFAQIYEPGDQMEIWNYKEHLPRMQLEKVNPDIDAMSGASWNLEKVGDPDFNSDGHIYYTFTNDNVSVDRYDQLIFLEPGVYRFTEARAPDGYKPSPYEYEFTVEDFIEIDEVYYASISQIRRRTGTGPWTELWNGEEASLTDEIEILPSNTLDNYSFLDSNGQGRVLRIVISNEPNELNLKKVDIEDENTVLPGAELRFYQVNATHGSPHFVDGKVVYLSEESYFVRRGPNVPSSKTITGTTNAQGMIHLEEIPTGHYFIKEEAAPQGYAKPKGFIGPYSMLPNGVLVKSTLGDNGEIIPGTVPIDEIVIENSPNVDIKVTKKWFDSTGEEINPPPGEVISFVLIRKTDTTNFSMVEDAEELPLSTDDPDQSVTWTDLPKYSEKGELYTYQIVEMDSLYAFEFSAEMTDDPTTETVYEFTATNTELKHPLSIKKVDGIDRTIPLEGAKLRVYKIVREGNHETVKEVEGVSFFVIGVGGGELTTDSEGTITLDVQPGVYLVEEISPPEGYVAQQETFGLILVDPDGNIYSDLLEVDGDGKVLIPNLRKGYMPNTGGPGVYAYILVGSMVMLLTIVGYLFTKIRGFKR